jgi:hypothetical protein
MHQKQESPGMFEFWSSVSTVPCTSPPDLYQSRASCILPHTFSDAQVSMAASSSQRCQLEPQAIRAGWHRAELMSFCGLRFKPLIQTLWASDDNWNERTGKAGYQSDFRWHVFGETLSKPPSHVLKLHPEHRAFLEHARQHCLALSS